ncbi:MAG: transketolase, partial [Lachnospiraceae bacterium]|nr:transketolase [Lachnospiraceae bacterium]
MADKQVVKRLEDQAYELREKLINLCGEYSGAVHIGGDLSMADILTGLFQYGLKLNPEDIKDPNRDRFILSKGHGAVCMYIAMAIRGFWDYDEIVKVYGKLDSPYGMHPCRVQLPALECSSGSLGQGLAMAVGMAISGKYK